MRRYAAFLRGVMPTNAKMPQLKKCFEAAGFAEVRTLLGSGNVVFSAASAPEASLERKAEAAMSEHLGRVFLTIVRSMDALQAIVDSDPFASFRLPPGSKQVVTFLRKVPTSKLHFPVEADGARILCVKDMEIFTSYVRGPS